MELLSDTPLGMCERAEEDWKEGITVNLNLLIVDDEKLDREGLFRQLDWAQHHISGVFLAKNGPAALEIMAQHSIDILFTDIKMPRVTGVELAQQARQRNPKLRIVFISGYDDFQYMKSAIQISAHEYIQDHRRNEKDGIVHHQAHRRQYHAHIGSTCGVPAARAAFD